MRTNPWWVRLFLSIHPFWVYLLFLATGVLIVVTTALWIARG
jgi:hypothetical protein